MVKFFVSICFGSITQSREIFPDIYNCIVISSNNDLGVSIEVFCRCRKHLQEGDSKGDYPL